jgi:hypothetical protein
MRGAAKWSGVLASLLLMAEISMLGARTQLIVRVYPYADLPEGSLDRSIKTAAAVLRRASVETAWERCATPAYPISDPGCAQRADKLVIQLRLHDHAGEKRMRPGADQFGYAVTPVQGLGVVAGVYLARVRRVVAEQGLDLEPVLGRLMAHEIAHLLLGPGSHSPAGIMVKRWRERELRLAVTGALAFTDAQSSQMTQQVSARLAARMEAAPTAVLATADITATPNSQPAETPKLLSQSGPGAVVSAARLGPRLP